MAETKSLTSLIFAVTLNWKQPSDTIGCLQSLQAQTHPNLKTLVVDNNSGDGSIAQISAVCPHTQIIANHENSGFSRGMNIGIKQALAADADFVFILNNDTFLAPDALEKLLDCHQPDIGALAPIIYYEKPSQTIWSLGNRENRWLLEAKKGMRGQTDRQHWPAVIEQDFVPACGLLIPRSVFEQVGYFDERFFMYYEDMDYCRRIRQAALRIVVVPRSRMWHKVSLSSGGEDSPNERYWMARSSVLYFWKHARIWQLPLIVVWRTGSALRTSWRLLRTGKRAALSAYWHGLWMGVKDIFVKEDAGL